MEEPMEVSDRILHASPAAAAAAPATADDARETEIAGGIASASAAVEDPPASVPPASEAAGEGVIAVEHERAAAHPVSETKMDVDEVKTKSTLPLLLVGAETVDDSSTTE